MKKLIVHIPLFVGLSILGSCGDGNKNLEYNNYTKVDTEAFKFLKEVYVESAFLQDAAANADLGGHAAEVASTYKELSQQIEQLAIENDVILPLLSENPYQQVAGYTPNYEPVKLVSADTSNLDIATEPAITAEIERQPGHEGLESSLNKRVIHSQEKIVHHFENVTRNTNVSMRRFAQDNIEKVERLLEQTGGQTQDHH